MLLAGYDADWLYAVSWGAVRRMSWGFWHAYADEAWALGSGEDWLMAAGRSPSGLDWTSLMAAAARFP